jgi:hypothetical protein
MDRKHKALLLAGVTAGIIFAAADRGQWGAKLFAPIPVKCDDCTTFAFYKLTT